MQNYEVSVINVLLLFRGKPFFGKKPDDSVDTLGVINLDKIIVSRTISEINAFLHFTQKFKMATTNGGKTILKKKSPDNCGYDGDKIFLLKSLYLAPFL